MTSKIFWGFWIIAWPTATLIQPLVTTRGSADDTIVTPAKRVAAPSAIAGPKSEPTSETLPEAPARDPFQTELGDPKATSHRISQPSPQPAEKAFDAEVFEKSERLPASAADERTEPAPRTAIRPNSIRRAGPELTAQEERAQKLIYERALVRAKQRQSRLAARQWMQSAPRLASKSASWQPQLTQPNVLAEMDRITNQP